MDTSQPEKGRGGCWGNSEKGELEKEQWADEASLKNSLLCLLLGYHRQLREGSGVSYRHLGQQLAIDLNPGLGQASHEPGV